jgi:hypothetical protein
MLNHLTQFEILVSLGIFIAGKIITNPQVIRNGKMTVPEAKEGSVL